MKKKNYIRQYNTALKKVMNAVNELEIKGFHFNKSFKKMLSKAKTTATKAELTKMKSLAKKESLYKRATSFTFQKKDGKHKKVSVQQGRQMLTQQARKKAADKYKDVLEEVIMSIPDDYYFYERKANGQFRVYSINVEDKKWECLDKIEEMRKVLKNMIDKIQSKIDYVASIAPSALQPQDVTDMFNDILAILNGGSYSNSSYGHVSKIGTPYENSLSESEDFEI